MSIAVCPGDVVSEPAPQQRHEVVVAALRHRHVVLIHVPVQDTRPGYTLANVPDRLGNQRKYI